MKIWVLDGDIAARDGNIQDTNIKYPLNHFRWLMNELTFLDRYIRTQGNELGEREDGFEQLKAKRILSLEKWITKINPKTGQTYKDWQMPYEKRPTLLTDDQFEDLAQAFAYRKATGQLSTAFNIVSGITDYCIDMQRCETEKAIDQHEDPEDTQAKLKAKAEEMKADNDNLYVDEMERIRVEILYCLHSLFAQGELEEMEIGESDLCLLGFCQQRNHVSITPGDPGHKGVISSGGGYRFKPLHFNGTAWEDLENKYIDGDTLSGRIEKTFEDFCVGELVINEEIEPPTYTFTELKSKADWPHYIKNRFDEINSRWITLNNLREYQIQNMGTRAIIESMVNAIVPDLSDDYESHFADRTNQKEYMTDILREICSEFR